MAKKTGEKNQTLIKKRTTAIASQRGAKKKKKGGIKEYFKGVRLEMKKVVWPTKKEIVSFTGVVLASCAAFALVFWAVDTGVLAAIRAAFF